MDWREEGLLLTCRRHGETAAIIEVFTESHGRHFGVVRGGAGRRLAPVLQPGAQLDVTWRARLEDHIGTYVVEPLRSRGSALMNDRKALAGMTSLTSLLSFALPEREAHAVLYRGTLAVLDMMEQGPYWPIAYLRWELALLEEMGFGLDLGRCAVTGATEGLAFVSPRSGRAVSGAGAGDWAERLMPLSPALVGKGDGTPGEIRDGLAVTGHFLTGWLAHSVGDRPLPPARQRLVDLLSRET